MTIFCITESNDGWHNFSTHIGDDQVAYAEYMICAAAPITAHPEPRSIRVEIIFGRWISPPAREMYRKMKILLEKES